jgi:hypothetical protein
LVCERPACACDEMQCHAISCFAESGCLVCICSVSWSFFPQTRAEALRVVIWVLVCWVLFPLGPLSLVMAITLPIAVWYAIRARSVVTVFLLLLNPLSLFFLSGVVDYAGGRPTLRGMGLPSPEYANIDRATRCRRSSGGCLIRGNEWISIVPHNLALRTMVFFFGPPSSAYDGPYPTREEAMAAVSAGGVPVSAEQFVSGALPTDTGDIRIDMQVMEKVGIHLFPLSGYGMGEAREGEQLHSVLWQGRCLILRWRRKQDADQEKDEVILLIDRRNSRPFAVYRVSGSSFMRRAAIDIFWR